MNTTRQFTRSVTFLAAFLVMSAASVQAADDQNTTSEKEKELLAVLRSDAPAAEKAVTCKLLTIHGSSEAVPDLAKLLPDPQLSSWARIALEAIPGEAADEALRKAAESLEGMLLVGAVNSIGVRQDANAVDLLTTRLQDKDAEVASAAAVALGRIGNASATESLRGALAAAPAEVRSAVAEGCVLCAERLHSQGNSAEAAAIYDQVRKADVPKQRIIEATRGAILARNQEGIPLLIEQFQSQDKAMFQIALSTAREFPGGEVDKALAAELARTTPDRAALLIQAMADRPDTVELSAVVQAAKQGPKPVRLAAVSAIGRVGDASCVSTLLEVAVEDDADLAQLARAALAELPSEKVDAQIVALVSEAEGDMYPLLIELVGQRRIDARSVLLKALNHSDPAVRHAALTALGETISLKSLVVLIARVISPRYPEDATVAQQALRAACVRMPDRDACATQLASAAERSSDIATKRVMLEILSEVGGPQALQALAAAAKSDADELQDTGSRLLGTWNSVEAAPVLLDLAKTAPDAKYQVRALRGYIGLARKFTMPESQRVEMCQKAFDATSRTAEQELVLDVLKIHPSVEGLKLAVEAVQVPELKQAATLAALTVAQQLGSKRSEVSELLSKAGLGQVKLEIIKAQYGAGSSFKDVTGILRKQAGDLPLITLPASSYDRSFGGDPAPGSDKQLKIQYRLNGQVGEASFAEDAPILLPMPE